MLQIKYKGPIYNCSGYSKLKTLFLRLSRRKHQVKIVHVGNKDDSVSFIETPEYEKLEQTELSSGYISICSGIGPQLRPDENAVYNIAYSMFETSKIPDTWIKFYNQFDEIWTPSSFCRDSFRIKDIDPETTVIPFGVDERVFFPDRKQHELFTFLAVGQWVDRKGWDLLINAYTQEFMGNYGVRLCIKTDEPYKTKEELVKEYLRTDITSQMPRIMINNVKISEATIPMLYQEADCFVLPSRGEAFGIPYMEAMSSGIPVIAPNFGGHLDFVSEESGWLIPIRRLSHLSDRLCSINSAYTDLWFAEPGITDIRKLLKNAYADREEVNKKGRAARKYVEDNMTWTKVTDIAERRLNQINKKLKDET